MLTTAVPELLEAQEVVGLGGSLKTERCWSYHYRRRLALAPPPHSVRGLFEALLLDSSIEYDRAGH